VKASDVLHGEILGAVVPGSEPGPIAPADGSPNSRTSEPPSSSWRPPSNAREFAGQANAVATMLLNGQLDMELARTYANLARTVAQAMSTEVTRARFLETLPDLTLPDMAPDLNPGGPPAE